MQLVVAATGTSSAAARPLPQAAPDPNEEGGQTILCGPCNGKQGETQASGTNITTTSMASMKKDMVVVSDANGGEVGKYDASSIARKSDGNTNGDATCSDTSCTDTCTDDDSEATSVHVYATEEEGEDDDDSDDGEFESLLQQVHELISQRQVVMIDRITSHSKIIDLNDLYIESLELEAEAHEEQTLYYRERSKSKQRKPFAGKRDLTLRATGTRIRILKKEQKGLASKLARLQRIDEEKSSEIQATSDQISDRLTLMSSNREEYSKLLERAYKSKRCAHCLNDAWKRKEGIKTTKRCSGCKAVHYCSEKCQAANWDVHQHFCQNLKDRRDERIAEWYEKDRRHRDFEEKLNCGWYGEESDAIGLVGSAGPFINELLGFGGNVVATKDSAYGSNAEDKGGESCCMDGCVIV